MVYVEFVSAGIVLEKNQAGNIRYCRKSEIERVFVVVLLEFRNIGPEIIL